MIDIEKIVDFVNTVYGINFELAKMTLLEMGIDPSTQKPIDNEEDCPCGGKHVSEPICKNCGLRYLPK